MGKATKEYPFCGKVHGPQFHMGLKEELLLVQGDLEHIRKVFAPSWGNSCVERNEVGPQDDRPFQNVVYYGYLQAAFDLLNLNLAC